MFNKYFKRLKRLGFTLDDKAYVYKSHSTDCSCYLCSGEKYSRKNKHKKSWLEE